MYKAIPRHLRHLRHSSPPVAAAISRQEPKGSCIMQGRVWDGRMQTEVLRTSAWTGEIEGVPVTLLRPDWHVSSLFRGGAIYGGSHSELEAYLYFSRLAHVKNVVGVWTSGTVQQLES